MTLYASIVLYRTPQDEVMQIVQTLHSLSAVQRIFLIDNSPAPATLPLQDYPRCRYVFCGRNAGYGAAHNIGLRQAVADGADLHLVVNSDIRFQADDLMQMAAYMQDHPDTGLLMPRVVYPDGRLQYLCKLLPTPLDLLKRRFLPARWTRRSTERYELRRSGYDQPMNVPYLSGCFMLLRTEALRQTGLFDERFFLYPEDIDLTRRLHRHWRTLYWPGCTIVHDHRRGSYRSLRLLWVHATNMCRYFNKYGWLHDKERDEMNRRCEEEVLRTGRTVRLHAGGGR